MQLRVVLWVLLFAGGCVVPEVPIPDKGPAKQSRELPREAVEGPETLLEEALQEEDQETRDAFVCISPCSYQCANGNYCCGPCDVCNAEMMAPLCRSRPGSRPPKPLDPPPNPAAPGSP